jgi:hypothetical protein
LLISVLVPLDDLKETVPSYADQSPIADLTVNSPQDIVSAG